MFNGLTVAKRHNRKGQYNVNNKSADRGKRRGSGRRQGGSQPKRNNSPRIMDFDKIGDNYLILDIQNALKNLKILKPTSVQVSVIPLMLRGEDVIVKSPQGSGKTAAYGIPILQKLYIDDLSPQAMILTPTGEDAKHVSRELASYGGLLKVKVLALNGDNNIPDQAVDLGEGTHIVVGTPASIVPHLESKAIDHGGINSVIIDGLDQMMELKMQSDIEWIINHTPESKLLGFFSSEIPSDAMRFAQKYSSDAQKVTVANEPGFMGGVEHSFCKIENYNKTWALNRFLKNREWGSYLVFLGNEGKAKLLAMNLENANIKCTYIDKDNAEKMLGEIPPDNFNTIILTSNIDLLKDLEKFRPDIIINYDMSKEPEAYLKIQNYAKAKDRCSLVNLITHQDLLSKKRIEKQLGVGMKEREIPGLARGERDAIRQIKRLQDLADIYGMVGLRMNLGTGDGLEYYDIMEFLSKTLSIPDIAVGSIEMEESQTKFFLDKGYASKVFDYYSSGDQFGKDLWFELDSKR